MMSHFVKIYLPGKSACKGLCIRRSTLHQAAALHSGIINRKPTEHQKHDNRSHISFPCMARLLLNTNTHQHVPSRQFLDRQTLIYYTSIDFAPIGYAYKFLDYVHTSTGLPWWGSIALSMFVMRTVITLPLVIYSNYVMAKLQCLQPEIKEKQQELYNEVVAAAKQYGWTKSQMSFHFAKNMRRIIKNLYIRDNCHPLKATTVAWFQIPMWVSVSLALRNMSGSLWLHGDKQTVMCPEMGVEGLLWFPNLLIPDPFFILPVLVGITNIMILEMNNLKSLEHSKFQKAVTYVLRGVSVYIMLIGIIMPSCMTYYWACSSFYGLGQNIFLTMPSVRRALRLPRRPKESDTPFRDMQDIAKIKYARWRNRKNTEKES